MCEWRNRVHRIGEGRLSCHQCSTISVSSGSGFQGHVTAWDIHFCSLDCPDCLQTCDNLDKPDISCARHSFLQSRLFTNWSQICVWTSFTFIQLWICIRIERINNKPGRDSKWMGTKLYVRGTCFEEFNPEILICYVSCVYVYLK